MGRTFIVLLLTLLLTALFFAMIDAGSANAQPFQQPQTQSSDSYVFGGATGRALGVMDGTATGGQHARQGFAFSAESSYLAPSPSDVCAIYQDFWFEEGYTCGGTQHYFDFVNGYMSGHQLGFLDGYIAGYYISGLA